MRLESTTSLGVNRPPKRYPNRSRPDRENAKAEASKRILSSSAFLIPRERTRWGQARMARSLTSRHSGQASCLSDLGRSVYPSDLKMIDVSLSDVRSLVGNGPVLIRLLLQSRRSKCFFASQILLFQAASLRSQYMTSDHRVAGSSPAGCNQFDTNGLPHLPDPRKQHEKSTCLDTSWTLFAIDLS